MSGANFRVPRPRLLGIERSRPGRLSSGDAGIVELTPGLAALLSLRDAEGRRVGEGLGLEWWIGLGAAATAAVLVGFEERGWIGVSASVDWLRASREDEALRARAAVERLIPDRFGRTSITCAFEVVAGERGDPIARGKLVLAESRASRGASPAGRTRETAAAGPASPTWTTEVPAEQEAATAPAAATLPRSQTGVLPREAPASPAQDLPALRWRTAPRTLEVGAAAPIEIEVRNDGPRPLAVEAELEVPFGHGLSAEWTGPHLLRLGSGESARVPGILRAHRPHEVNLGRPWPMACVLKSGESVLGRAETPVEVPDDTPGLLLYVLTEDCETFDGGPRTGAYGAASVLGNANDSMDPEDYRVQMIEKPAALNRIADEHGARFTHFWTTTQLSAAEWACGQSTTGAWPAIVRDLEESVRSGAARHEYAPHIHFDFEPDSLLPPRPRLTYDPLTDGLLPADYYDPVANPDHRYHGWDGARKGFAYVKRQGDLQDIDSKTGSLRKATRRLARLCIEHRHPLVTRSGACDFGMSPEDLAISFGALGANGLLANADAGLYETGRVHPRGRQVYFCRRDDLEAEIESLGDAAFVQLRAPEVQVDGVSLDELNAWFDRRVAQSAGPGVRAVVAMTHAMFMKGAPDPYRDTRGGDFEKLDRHLAWVTRNHPRVRFATASEAIVEFLDYYTPTLRAVAVRPAARSTDGRARIYPVRILGRGIPLSPGRPLTVAVLAPPAFDPEELEALTVYEDGAPIASASPAAGSLTAVEFQARKRDGYLLEVRTKAVSAAGPWLTQRPAAGSAPRYLERAEETPADLLRLEAPRIARKPVDDGTGPTAGDSWQWIFPAELFRLLVKPIAGRDDPLARRLHPYGWAPLGMAVHACQQVLAGLRPSHAELRWLRSLTGDSDFRLEIRLERVTPSSATVEGRFFESAFPVAQMRITLERGPDPLP